MAQYIFHVFALISKQTCPLSSVLSSLLVSPTTFGHNLKLSRCDYCKVTRDHLTPLIQPGRRSFNRRYMNLINLVSNQIADSHFAASLNRGISWPQCHNVPDAIIPPNMKSSLLLSEIQDVHASSHLNWLKYLMYLFY